MPPARVRRLNAAVVVNHRSSTDAKGKTTSTPLSAEELEKITALVQQSLGFSQERGDSVRVINAPFRVEAPPKVEAIAAAPAALAASTCCAPPRRRWRWRWWRCWWCSSSSARR